MKDSCEGQQISIVLPYEMLNLLDAIAKTYMSSRQDVIRMILAEAAPAKLKKKEVKS